MNDWRDTAPSAVSEAGKYTNLFLLGQLNQPMSRDEFRDLRGNMVTAIRAPLLGQGENKIIEPGGNR